MNNEIKLKTFKEFIFESIINLFDESDKGIYVDEVWNLLMNSYKDIGGIKGSGFENKEAMKKKMKLWKLSRKNGKINAGLLYKDKGMRKTVAVFTDGSLEGKKALESMLKDDFSRSSIEVSHSLLKFIKKKMPSLVRKYAIPSDKVSSIIGKDIEIVSEYEYIRDINGTLIRKMMIGSINKFYEF